MNRKPKDFLKALQKSIDQARDTQKSIFESLEMPGFDIEHKKICLGYAMALQRYVEAAERMIVECTMAYGKGSNAIAIESANLSNGN